jgi:hypothetical protein
MLIILALYVIALWAIFLKFKLIRWGWGSGSVSVSILLGCLILATFLALFLPHANGKVDRNRQGG